MLRVHVHAPKAHRPGPIGRREEWPHNATPKNTVDRLASIMEDKRDTAESAIKPRRMRGSDFYCAVLWPWSAIFETYATSAK